MINEHNIYSDKFHMNRTYISEFGDFLYFKDNIRQPIGMCWMFIYSSINNREIYSSYSQYLNRHIKEIGHVYSQDNIHETYKFR